MFDDGSGCLATDRRAGNVRPLRFDESHKASHMHRDQKLGLALGILVIGFAAAFCFRRSVEPAADCESHISASELAAIDQEISQLPVRTYTRPPVVVVEVTPQTPDDQTLAELFELRDAADIGTVAEPTDLDHEWPDASLPFGPREATEAIVQLDEDAPSPAPEPQLTTYTVEPGDTLSSIAARHLGDSRKFLELIELNEDRLPNPNRLRPGMQIQVPRPMTAELTTEERDATMSR